jgi:hypothetical protein
LPRRRERRPLPRSVAARRSCASSRAARSLHGSISRALSKCRAAFRGRRRRAAEPEDELEARRGRCGGRVLGEEALVDGERVVEAAGVDQLLGLRQPRVVERHRRAGRSCRQVGARSPNR